MTGETQKLIEEIKEYYKVSELSELNEKQWAEIEGGWNSRWTRRLTEEFIDMYAGKFNWNAISEYQILSEPFMEKYADRINWEYISIKQKLSEPFIKKYADSFNWEYIVLKQKLSENFIEENLSRFDLLEWINISRHQNISPIFIKKHFDKINFRALFENKNIEEIKNSPEKHPEWTDVFILAGKNGREFPKSDIKRKIQTRKFWKSYINYLKSEYPDKNMFKVKLFDRIIEISDIFNMDKNKILKIINKSLKKEEKKSRSRQINR